MSSAKLFLLLFVGTASTLAAGESALAQNLLGMPSADGRSNALLAIDKTNANIVGGVSVQLPGSVILGCNGLATHPVTGELWGLLNIRGAGRHLVKINPVTGTATSIGTTSAGGRSFAGISFNADGSILYGVTGDGSNDSESLFTLNQSTGAATLQCQLGNGNDGEAIAFNSTDGKLYHGSGNRTQVFETIDDTGTCSTTNIPLSGDVNEFLAVTYVASENRFYVTGFSDLFTLTPTGTVNLVGTNPFDLDIKGLAINPAAPSPPPCSPLATLYVSTTYGNSQESGLWAVNAGSGATRYVGRIGFERVGSLDFGPDERLYGVGERLGTGTQVLITIDPCTGAGTEIAPITGLSGFTTDISFRNSDQVLMGYNTSHQVYSINTTTGVATVLGNSGNNGGGNGIAFSPTDTLFHSDQNNLNTLNQTTGAATLVNALTFPPGPANPYIRATCMDFRPGTSDLYAVINEYDNNTGYNDQWYLAMINSSTAVVTAIGQTISGADGMAFSPPTGSCCVASGGCTVTTRLNCAGTWTQGATCSPNPCPQPTGACCHSDGTCANNVVQADCSGAGEEWHEGVSCDSELCTNEAIEIDPSVSVQTDGGVTATGSVSRDLPANPPAGATFPNGLITLRLNNVPVGGATNIKLTLILPAGQSINSYFKFGVEPGNTTPHWYPFDFDGATGAEINGNVVTLHFGDGQRGDNDLAANGIIDDPGGPANKPNEPAGQTAPGTGLPCFNPLLSYLLGIPICGIGCLVSLVGTIAGIVAMRVTAVRHHRRRSP